MDLYIWGTGRYSDNVVEYINKTNKKIGTKLFDIVGYIDSNLEKSGKEYSGFIVSSPAILRKLNKKTRIVVAIKEDYEVLKVLEDYPDLFHYTYKDFVLREHALFDVIKEECTDHDVICPEITEKLQIRSRFEHMYAEGYSYDKILYDLGADYAVAALYAEYRNYIEEADKFVRQVKPKKNKKQIRTIAFYYNRFFSGGIERVMSILIDIFIHHGYEVVLITDETVDRQIEYETDFRLIRRVLPSKNEDPYLWTVGFARLIDELDIDVICNHDYASECNYYLGLLGICKDCLLITEIHNYFAEYIKLSRRDMGILYSYNDCIVVLSKADEDYWRNLGINCRYIPNPVYSPAETKKKRLESRKNKKTLLWIGRLLDAQKNVFDIVDVMKEIVRTRNDIKLKIVGAADAERIIEELKKRIHENNLENSIELCGYHIDVAPYFLEADIMIMTSSYEGFPMTLAEAMGYGVPVVLYDLPYLELLRSGEGYIAVGQRDTRSMAEAVLRILADDELWSKLSGGAIENSKQFSSIDVMKEWERVFYGCD